MRYVYMVEGCVFFDDLMMFSCFHIPVLYMLKLHVDIDIVQYIKSLRIVFFCFFFARFCPDEYYPFEPTNINKYVITDEYKPPWEIPKMAKYYTDEDTTRKQAFMQVLEEEGEIEGAHTFKIIKVKCFWVIIFQIHVPWPLISYRDFISHI